MLMIVLDFGSLHIFQWRNRLRSCHLINQRNGYVINTTCKNKNKKTIRKYFYIKNIYIYASNMILTSKMDLILIMGWWQVEQDIFLVLWSYFWIIFKVVHAERPAELLKIIKYGKRWRKSLFNMSSIYIRYPNSSLVLTS